MPHDQFFKELLREFFREFFELLLPDIARQLDFSQVTFLDKEIFTDLPAGEQREADLVARIATVTGEPEIIAIHVEVERQRRGSMPARMHDYHRMLRLRERVLIYPLVLYLSPGTGGITRETHIETVLGEEVVRFSFAAVGLPDLRADDYKESANPLAYGLTALMKVSALGAAVQKEWSLRHIARSAENEARKSLLVNLVEAYLPLTEAEEAEFTRLTANEEAEEIREMLTVYEERGIEKGIERGIAIAEERAKQMLTVYEERGIEKGIERGIAIAEERAKQMLTVYEERGIEKGIERGIAIAEERAKQMLTVYEERGIEKGIEQGVEKGAFDASRRSLLKVLRRKFGELPEIVIAQIGASSSTAELDEWFDRALDAETLEEVGISASSA